MQTPETKKFTLIILVFFILQLFSGSFLGLLMFYLSTISIIQFCYLAATLFLLYKGKSAGWYMTIIYFAINLILSVIFIFSLYSNLIKNSDANWGGILTFLLPLPPLLIYIIALTICLKRNNRELYTINLSLKQK